jgi:ribosomal protein L31E
MSRNKNTPLCKREFEKNRLSARVTQISHFAKQHKQKDKIVINHDLSNSNYNSFNSPKPQRS